MKQVSPVEEEMFKKKFVPLMKNYKIFAHGWLGTLDSISPQKIFRD